MFCGDIIPGAAVQIKNHPSTHSSLFTRNPNYSLNGGMLLFSVTNGKNYQFL